MIASSVNNVNSVIIPPVFLGENVELKDSVVGPHVSVGENTIIKNSRISNSIIQSDSNISNALLADSMLGNFVTFEGKPADLSIGDYNSLEYK